MKKWITISMFLLMTANAQSQSFDFYPAREKSKAPILLFVHGGAWVGGRASQYKELGGAFRDRGICFVAIDYRLAPEFQHPAPVDDLQSSLDKLIKSSPPGCDVSKIFLMGHSAGAHMIAFWSSLYTLPAVRGFIGLEGIYDIPALVKKWPPYQSQFIESEFGPSANWNAASPTLIKLIHRAPWLVIHSQQDKLVDVDQSAAFEKHLVKEGLKSELKVLQVGSHFGVVDVLKDKNSPASVALAGFMK